MAVENPRGLGRELMPSRSWDELYPGREASSTTCAMGLRDPQGSLESGDPMARPVTLGSRGRLGCRERRACRDLSDQPVTRENAETTEFPASQETQERTAQQDSRVPQGTSDAPEDREPQDTRESRVWQDHQEREAVQALQELRDTQGRKETRETLGQLVPSAPREPQDPSVPQDNAGSVVLMVQPASWETLVWTEPRDKWVCAAHPAPRE